jgi:hypothetical protein
MPYDGGYILKTWRHEFLPDIYLLEQYTLSRCYSVFMVGSSMKRRKGRGDRSTQQRKSISTDGQFLL